MKGYKMKLITIYDKQTGYNPPVVHVSEGAAIRWFSEMCADEKSPLHKHPGDFSLLVIGDWDEKKGISGLENGIHEIANAGQFVPELVKN